MSLWCLHLNNCQVPQFGESEAARKMGLNSKVWPSYGLCIIVWGDEVICNIMKECLALSIPSIFLKYLYSLHYDSSLLIYSLEGGVPEGPSKVQKSASWGKAHSPQTCPPPRCTPCHLKDLQGV